MTTSWEEVEQLARILEDEIRGRPVDRREAQRLATRLAELCPDIAISLGQIRERMAVAS